MIGSLRGRLAAKHAPVIVVECAGVGYEVETPMSTFLELSAVGSDVSLHTHLQVRDDAHILYGFATSEEKNLFRLLLKVNGVGAKMALAILSGMGVADFERSVRFEDAAMLVKIPGVGKKTAERLIIEMRDRIETSPAQAVLAKGPDLRTDPRSEAIDALVALGYKPAEVRKLLATFDLEGKSAEDIIRRALRQAVT
jgi:Holliday junction DNA helicase RuvA